MSLAKRSIESSIYNVGSHGFQVVILFIRSVLLARLLSPEIFGIYAFTQAIIVTTRVIPSFGLGSAYVHHSPESDHPDAPSVYFTLITLFTLAWAVSLGLLALIFHYENQWVLWVLIATSFISQLVAPAQAILVKRIAFRRPATLALITAVFTTFTSILIAKNDGGIWALLSVDIVTVTISMIGFYVLRPVWSPRIIWSPSIVRYFLKFGSQVIKAGILGQALDRFDDLWTGYFLGSTALGFYSRAYTFANYPRRIIAAPINAVAFGTYAEVKNNHKQLSQAFFRTNALIIRFSLMFAGILFLIAPEFIRLVLGVEWLPMLNAFRLMLVYTMLDPIKMTIGNMFTAIGQPKILTQTRAIQLLVLVIGLFLLGTRWGISGVAIATTNMTIIGITILLWQARKYVDYSIYRLFSVPFFALTIGILFSYYATSLLIPTANIETTVHDWQSMFVKSGVFALVYSSILFLMEYKQLLEIITFAKHHIKRQG